MQINFKMLRHADAEAVVSLRKRRRWFDGDGQQQTPPPPGGTQTGGQQQQQKPGAGGETPPATWEAWLAAQPEAERTLIGKLHEGATAGLQSALHAEREQRKTFQTQLADLTKKAEKGSELETRLTEMGSALETANRRADFVTEAARPEIGVSDIGLAWIVVSAAPDEYFDKQGRINFTLLKQRHPTLFKAPPPPPANAGAGSQSQPPATGDMNRWIREAARRG